MSQAGFLQLLKSESAAVDASTSNSLPTPATTKVKKEVRAHSTAEEQGCTACRERFAQSVSPTLTPCFLSLLSLLFICQPVAASSSGGASGGGWKVLQDDYLMGGKMTDWDKADSSEEEEDE